MKRLFVLLVAFLLLACSPPPFDLDTCVTQCNQCPDVPCEAICADLSRGIQDPVCHDVSEDLWYCALATGCYFPDECVEEIETFLSCP